MMKWKGEANYSCLWKCMTIVKSVRSVCCDTNRLLVRTSESFISFFSNFNFPKQITEMSNNKTNSRLEIYNVKFYTFSITGSHVFDILLHDDMKKHSQSSINMFQKLCFVRSVYTSRAFNFEMDNWHDSMFFCHRCTKLKLFIQTEFYIDLSHKQVEILYCLELNSEPKFDRSLQMNVGNELRWTNQFFFCVHKLWESNLSRYASSCWVWF